MARSTSVIEINGNQYDAVSGQLVGAVKKAAAQVSLPAKGAIDGLVRRPATIINKTRADYKASNIHRPLQHSKTLMRNGVKRPAPAKNTKASTSNISKARVAMPSAARVLHAKSTPKNTRVDRFGKLRARSTALVGRTTPQTLSPTLKAGPKPASAAAVTSAKPLPSMITSVSHQHLERLLDQALVQADSHKQALRARAKGWRRVTLVPKSLVLGVSFLALLLVSGFFAWQNIPQVSMRVANTRSHVSASVPAYTPTGYSYESPVSVDSGKVSISYKSPGNNSFTITQQNSNWDSSTVAAAAVPAGTQVQTSQVNGTTVYIYGNSNDAKWVNHGVLFTLQDKGNLSSDEILKIANGL